MYSKKRTGVFGMGTTSPKPAPSQIGIEIHESHYFLLLVLDDGYDPARRTYGPHEMERRHDHLDPPDR